MKYCFDIDGTICSNTYGDYEKAEPYYSRIEKIKELVSNGHEVYFFTARGSETGIDWSILTQSQLSSWGLPTDNIFFGKPSADLYIDDRAISDKYFFTKKNLS